MSLFGFGFIVLIIFTLIVYGLTLYLRSIVGLALTDKFQAAEAISKGHIPEKWVRQINRRLRRQRLIPVFQRSGSELVAAKIDELYRYFENSRFVEDERTRTILLTQLREAKARWSTMKWDEAEVVITGKEAL